MYVCIKYSVLSTYGVHMEGHVVRVRHTDFGQNRPTPSEEMSKVCNVEDDRPLLTE